MLTKAINFSIGSSDMNGSKLNSIIELGTPKGSRPNPAMLCPIPKPLNEAEEDSVERGFLLGLDLDQSSRACIARATRINDRICQPFYVPAGVTIRRVL